MICSFYVLRIYIYVLHRININCILSLVATSIDFLRTYLYILSAFSVLLLQCLLSVRKGCKVHTTKLHILTGPHRLNRLNQNEIYIFKPGRFQRSLESTTDLTYMQLFNILAKLAQSFYTQNYTPNGFTVDILFSP